MPVRAHGSAAFSNRMLAFGSRNCRFPTTASVSIFTDTPTPPDAIRRPGEFCVSVQLPAHQAGGAGQTAAKGSHDDEIALVEETLAVVLVQQ